ncbi:phage tail protein [Lysinibacillus sp. M3]|uniref:Phage tail protein n=1 Tax=Lysinibacillus zambalensis TaxID=3160866 RepID=A0ABV1MUV3_9BACI
MSNSTTLMQARSHFAQAHAGFVPLRPIVKMAFGSGGVDEKGNPIPPDATVAALNTELYRKDIESYTFTATASVTFVCVLTADEINNTELSEVALVDSNGSLVAIKTFRKKYKDNETEIMFEWTEKF